MTGSTDIVQRVLPSSVVPPAMPRRFSEQVGAALTQAVHDRRIYSAETVRNGWILKATMVRGRGQQRDTWDFSVPLAPNDEGDADLAARIVSDQLANWDEFSAGVPACWGAGYPLSTEGRD